MTYPHSDFPHPAYPKSVSATLYETLDSFRLPEGEDPHGVLAMVHLAFYQLAHNIADRVPNSPLLDKAVKELREALDATVAAYKVNDDGNR